MVNLDISTEPLRVGVALKDPGLLLGEASGPNKPYKKPGLAYRPGQAEGAGLDW